MLSPRLQFPLRTEIMYHSSEQATASVHINYEEVGGSKSQFSCYLSSYWILPLTPLDSSSFHVVKLCKVKRSEDS